jgi:TonB-linked SusC/RagA family outer membrane protein
MFRLKVNSKFNCKSSILKYIFWLFGLIFLSLPLTLYGQNANVSISVKNVSLKELLTRIEKTSDIRFSYVENSMDEKKDISITANNEPIERLLDRVLSGKGMEYTKTGNTIAIKPVQNPPSDTKKITGTITDEKGEPVIGANVVEKGTTNGTITDVNGEFSLTVSVNATLQISFIGYIAQEISALSGGGGKPLVIKLLEDAQALDEVVVVGYGTQKKVNLTGAIEVVDGERLKDRPVANVSQAMQGAVSGLSFSYSDAGAEPGAKLSLQIRGQGSPYVLIDGTVGDINTIDPNDIENISVLKDAASSAIYGARAPYGVVLITTKSGKRDEKIHVDFSTNVAYTQPIRKPHWVDSYTFVRAMNEIHDNQGESRLFAEETIDRIIAHINDPSLPETVPDPSNPSLWATYLLANGNNDWYDIHFGSGMRNQENLSVKGGNKNIGYFLSVGHSYEKGILNFGTDNFDRLNLNSKFDIDLADWWKLSSNTRTVQSTRIQPNYDSEGGYGMMIRQIYRTQPQQYLKSPNGVYAQLSRIPMVDSGTDKTIGRGLMQRFSSEITPLKGWTINADYSFDFSYDSWIGENFTMYQDMVDGTLTPISTTVPSYIEKYKSHTFYQSLNVYTSYLFDLKEKHHFQIMMGYQQESSAYDYLYGQKKEMITPAVPSIATSTGEIQLSDQMTHWATEGYFARLNYNYLGKYLVELVTRYDGTSKFTKNHRWGLFPSASLAWNISHENFWESLSAYINSMKVKVNWGSLGNQNVNAYQDLPLLGTSTNLGWILNSKRPAYTTAPNLINPYLTWESSQTIDGGLEMGLLNNRLQLTADYYQRLTFNRLGPSQALPAVLGATVPSENNSELRTRGWDVSLTWRDKVNKDFAYSITAMLYDYTNVVTEYNNPTGILTTDYEGKTVGEIWGYETLGLIQTQEEADLINSSKSQNFINAQVWRTGDVHYTDLNNDGVINNGKNTLEDHGDLKVIGNTTPRYQFGLTLGAEYKNFDFTVFFQGTAKRDLWLNSNMFWGFENWNFTILYPHHTDYYRDTEDAKYSGLGVNTDAYYPRPYSQAAQYNKNKQTQTRYLQNAAYIRLKNLQLGYTIPQSLIRKINLQRGRIYFSAENLLTLTKLPIGFDPETANLGNGNGNTMFSLAVLSLGLNVSF